MDVEDPSWEPTVSFGGGHDVNDSYGLVQANPGVKMAVWAYTATGHHAGDPVRGDWLRNPWVQLRWGENYAVGRYGSVCAAWRFRRENGWW